jgi:hypothetical protein
VSNKCLDTLTMIHTRLTDLGIPDTVGESNLATLQRLELLIAELEKERLKAAAVFFPLDGAHHTEQALPEGHALRSPLYDKACEIRDRMEAAEAFAIKYRDAWLRIVGATIQAGREMHGQICPLPFGHDGSCEVE